MNIIAWLILGLIAGFLANMLDPRPEKGGLIGAVILGIVGAIIGGFIGSVFLGIGISGFNISSILIATGGAILLLFLTRFLQSF